MLFVFSFWYLQTTENEIQIFGLGSLSKFLWDIQRKGRIDFFRAVHTIQVSIPVYPSFSTKVSYFRWIKEANFVSIYRSPNPFQRLYFENWTTSMQRTNLFILLLVSRFFFCSRYLTCWIKGKSCKCLRTVKHKYRCVS